ncbi:MAG: hypothetical protein K1X54_05775 [Flavobacteriales bacterium]|nr:hypothetical protein [Flavobacteriales bacterium]
MKKLMLFLLLATTGMFAKAQADVTLNFTISGQPVCGYEITIKHGDVAIGAATTDPRGNASFEGVALLSKSIDIHGVRKTKNGEKSFDAKGYVTLDENNHADIHFEDFIKEAAEDSGMPESLFIDAWGLTDPSCE